MKSNSFHVLRRHLFREVMAAWLVGALLLQSATAVVPDWWSTQGVLIPNKPADDYAVANVGQLKNLAKKAAQEMNAVLPGGVGAAIDGLTVVWASAAPAGVVRDDYAALNAGQLKSVAKPFYDRLLLPYPWTMGTELDDFAVVNLGQLKAVFAFDLSAEALALRAQLAAFEQQVASYAALAQSQTAAELLLAAYNDIRSAYEALLAAADGAAGAVPAGEVDRVRATAATARATARGLAPPLPEIGELLVTRECSLTGSYSSYSDGDGQISGYRGEYVLGNRRGITHNLMSWDDIGASDPGPEAAHDRLAQMTKQGNSTFPAFDPAQKWESLHSYDAPSYWPSIAQGVNAAGWRRENAGWTDLGIGASYVDEYGLYTPADPDPNDNETPPEEHVPVPEIEWLEVALRAPVPGQTYEQDLSRTYLVVQKVRPVREVVVDSTVTTVLGTATLSLPADSANGTATFTPTAGQGSSGVSVRLVGGLQVLALEPPRQEEMRVEITLAAMELDVDTNRDGVISTDDDVGEDQWTNFRGAIYGVNFDRDGENTSPDKLKYPNGNALPLPDAILWTGKAKPEFEDWKIEDNGDDNRDFQDITPLKIAHIPSLPQNAKVYLKVKEMEDMRAVHFYKRRKAGEEAIWGGVLSEGKPWADGDAEPTDIEVTQWINEEVNGFADTRPTPGEGDFEFGIEGLVLRGMRLDDGTLPNHPGKFSGVIDISLEVEIGGVRAQVDTVRMKVAPWLMVQQSQPAQTTFVSNVPGNPVSSLPKTHGVVSATQFTQDQAEFGYTQAPGLGAQSLAFIPPADGKHYPFWLFSEYLGADKGVFSVLGFSELGDKNSMANNFGGNIELYPPHTGYPLGRIIYGSNMHSQLQIFLTAQEIQLPIGATVDVLHLGGVNVSYLQVGHVDEIIKFQEDGSALVASPSLGLGALSGLKTESERMRGLFFSRSSTQAEPGFCASSTVDTQTLKVVTQKDFLESEAAWKKFENGWVRFVKGASAGQMARIKKLSRQQTRIENAVVSLTGGPNGGPQIGMIENKIIIEVDLVYRPGSTAMSDSARFRVVIDNKSTNSWFVRPLAGDCFVLIEQSDVLWWLDAGVQETLGISQNGLPAPISAFELQHDAAFIQWNNLLQQKIDQTLGALPKGLAMKKIPALFHRYSDKAMSFAPNATNCQQIDSGTYFPQQFAPRGTDNNDGFQKMIDQIVPNSNYIDDWTPLHLYEGEIHCGSNVLRQIPSSNWWNAINAN